MNIRKKKPILLGAAVGVSGLLLAATFFFAGAALKQGIEAITPMLTKCQVQVESARMSLWGGGGFWGFVLGNPQNGDFKSTHAMKIGRADVKVKPLSLLSNTVVVEEVRLDGVEIQLEGLTDSNQEQILDNIKSFTDDNLLFQGKKIIIGLLSIRNTKLNFSLMGKMMTIPIPDLDLKDIGKDDGGLSLKDTLSTIHTTLLDKIMRAVKSMPDIGETSGNQIKAKAKGAGQWVQGLFKEISSNESDQ